MLQRALERHNRISLSEMGFPGPHTSLKLAITRSWFSENGARGYLVMVQSALGWRHSRLPPTRGQTTNRGAGVR